MVCPYKKMKVSANNCTEKEYFCECDYVECPFYIVKYFNPATNKYYDTCGRAIAEMKGVKRNERN